jgi:glycosyltransferase involved in cell wall biosynthesis
MRIAVLAVVGSLEVGGAERHLVQVLPRLDTARFQASVFCLTHRGTLAGEIEAAGVPVRAPAERPRADGALMQARRGVAALWRLRRTLRASRPDVAHFFLPAAYLVGGIASLGAPVRRRVMSRRSLNDYQRDHPALARLERLLHRRMDAVLGNAQAVVDQLRREGAPAGRLGLIYNGVDPGSAADRRGEVRGRLGIAEDALVAVLVANLIAYKGHADLLRGLAAERQRLPTGWTLLCVGRDDGIGAELRALAHHLGVAEQVRWLGQRDDASALLAAADIGILCSHQEGFSNAILEGMAAGLPMLVTDVGGNAEAVVDGETGLVVPAHDPARLGAALASLAGDPARRRAMGAAGRRRVREHFSLDACVAAYERLYEGLLTAPGRPVQALIDAD